MKQLAFILSLILLAGGTAACSTGSGAGDAAVALADPAVGIESADPAAPSATAVASASATTVPAPPPTSTATQPPPATATPFPTATPLPTSTPPPSPTPTATIALVATSAAQPCPAEAPLKPVYDRYYLPLRPWPTPDPAFPRDHFWLEKPLPGGGRFLTNQRFPYGYDENGRLLLHTGSDSAEKLGTPVLAVGDGTVVVAQGDQSEMFGWRCDWYGQLVVIELDQTWNDLPIYALYGHVLNVSVQPGQRVAQGDPVAEVGFGGAATAPHLHFEVRVGENAFGSTRNPLLWVRPPDSRGVVAGRLVDPEGRPWQGVVVALVPVNKDAETLGTWTYLGDPDGLANPDEALAENFVFSDVPPGDYDVLTELQGVTYRIPVTVFGGDLQVVELVTEPYVPPTATAVAPPPEETIVPEVTATPGDE